MPKPKKSKTPSSERTSASIATVAGQLLSGTNYGDAHAWLQRVSIDPKQSAGDRANAVTLLGVLDSVKRVAASALTQR